MSHWAKIDENNVVTRVIVGNDSDQNGDEGYQWIVNTYGGRWLKCSYNTIKGIHILNGTPLRGNYPGMGYTYHEDIDAFMPPKEYPSWVIDTTNYTWISPVPKPDSGFWVWDEDTVSWKEYNGE